MAEDPKHSKSTKTFDRGQLAKLTAATRPQDAEISFDDIVEAVDAAPGKVAQGSAPTQRPAIGRVDTISDPMTMALLAEVARNSQTTEFDPEQIAEALKAPQPSPADVHPHLKRRNER
jgi:hypothetical protein